MIIILAAAIGFLFAIFFMLLRAIEKLEVMQSKQHKTIDDIIEYSIAMGRELDAVERYLSNRQPLDLKAFGNKVISFKQKLKELHDKHKGL